jgi:rhodanese-related sulfurtransferase
VIDVRDGTEIAETGSIANAVNIPRGLIEMKLTPNNPDKSLNANTPIIVYCGGGSRASLAGKTLIELGFKNVQNLEGGFRGWKEFSS